MERKGREEERTSSLDDDPLRMHEHAPDGVEGDHEEVGEEEEGFGSEGGKERDGSGNGLTSELEVLEASGLEDFEVGVCWTKNERQREKELAREMKRRDGGKGKEGEKGSFDATRRRRKKDSLSAPKRS